MARTQRQMISSISVVLLVATLCRCDVNQDKQECANQLVGLATCLPYVGGEAKAPTQDCCTGFKQVLKNSRKCLCILIKDRNDPSLGLKVNATLALSLPHTCHAEAVDAAAECPALLHLPPNSPDAKVFTDFAKAAPPTTTTSTSAGKSTSAGGGTSAKETSDSAHNKKWLVAQMFCGALIWCLVSHLVL